ncbi:hypothetical protein DNTS_014650 [Danionella cerebrum]|uniref:Lysine-specific demethylase n=1 Tax=Danionella cerebrum TaxID=2873325 RepID=A0A553Q1W4_9TELE|nr:hypothetical protein DNTS_014650 [Danionella translucida]
MGDSLGLIGKRLLLLINDGSPGAALSGSVEQAAWLRGTVRAVSVMGLASLGVEVFIEFEENRWRKRTWVQVYGEEARAVLVEDAIVWADCSSPSLSAATGTGATRWPVLVFKALVDHVGLGSIVPVELFGSKTLAFLPNGNSLQAFEMEKDLRHGLLQDKPALHAAISSWKRDSELQEILRKGSYSIQGQRVKVYQPEFEDSWVGGVVSRHDAVSHMMEINLEQGKSTQVVDPRVIHVMLAAEQLDETQGAHKKEGEGSRRRRTASGGDEDVTLKRFKGAGEAASDSQNGKSSNDAEAMVTSVEMLGEGAEEEKDCMSRLAASTCTPVALPNQDSTNTPNPSQQEHSHLRSPVVVKENGDFNPNQEGLSSIPIALPVSTPTPPPLKPAPSTFSNTFPSLGQMPNLVPGAPNQKSSPTLPATKREEGGIFTAYPKTAALVSPGPVTISSPSHDNTSSVVLSAPVDLNQKPGLWGTAPEASQTLKAPTLAAVGFGTQSVESLFGNAITQTNGSTQDKPFGFGFGAGKEPQKQNPAGAQNLFFQFISQNQSGTQSQPKAFASLSECVNKEPPSLFMAAPTGLFGSASGVGLSPMKDQPKASETKPAGNGLLIAKPFRAAGEAQGKPLATFPSASSAEVLKPSLGLVSGGLGSSFAGVIAGSSPVSGFGLLAGSKVSETHENLFLQASKETNPFLAYGKEVSHSPFSALSSPKSQSASAVPPPGSNSLLGQDPPGNDARPNLFTMANPPKGILAPQFSAPTPSFTSVSLDGQQTLKLNKENLEVGFSTQLNTECEGLPVTFEQSKFSLEERGQSSKKDSETSSNSDLSDLSDAEDNSGQKLDVPGGSEDKSKIQAAAKSRPRSKPFKAGQSVLKDLSKVRRLKQSGEAFLQDGSCINVAPHLHKCRECRLERYRKAREQDSDEDDPNVACRFFHFRRLAFTKKGVLRVEGFLSPQQSDSMAMGLWLPSLTTQEGLDLDTSKYILANVGDQFCQLVMSEKEAMMMVEPHQKVAWKRAVRGVREMCDVCETTLFNIHWVCRKCGFGVCLDCYRLRKNKPPEVEDAPDEDVFSWLKCAKGQPHEPQNLMPTQIIPGTALYSIGDMVHAARGKWGIKANCPCISRHKSLPGAVNSSGNGTTPTPAPPRPNGEATAGAVVVKTEPVEEATGADATLGSSGTNTVPSSPAPATTPTAKDAKSSSSALHWLADLATQKEPKESLRSMMSRDSRAPFGLDSLSSLSKPSGSTPKLFNSLLLGAGPSQPKPEGTSLRDLLNSGSGKLSQAPSEGGVPFPPVFTTAGQADKIKGGLPNFLDHIIASVVETKKAEVRRGSGSAEGGESGTAPPRREGVMGLSVLDPHTSHSWLCDGRLLCLHDPCNSNNWKIFRECWKQGQPVLVSGIHKKLKGNLWNPDAFSMEFGDQDVDLVNCRNCAIISDVKVREFFDGFQVVSKRLRGSDGQPMVLKLKDWPPGEDFRDMMPTRFHDLMDNLPLPEYTKRDGRLNLASRLISTEDRKVGTTNLHLDVSDAVNVMVYVGIPEGENDQENEVMQTIEEGDVDDITKRRVYEIKEKPGALWHIYSAKDAEKIRELLRKVGEEQGQENPPDHDPIHDQSWYLDQTLRRRLYEEYGVQGWSIVQFLGDAVFIPAGAPHQVHNLYSCIKVAEDFVSPEHVRHCFRLTQEFRHLSTTHTNHEDKLQVKNIIYHAVKDAVSTLKAFEPKLGRS